LKLVRFLELGGLILEWSGLFDLLVGMGNEAGVCPEQKLAVYQQVKANLMSVPEIAKHADVAVSARQIKVSWKKGGQIARINRYDHAQPLTEFLIGEVARRWMQRPSTPSRKASARRCHMPAVKRRA
jgi:hypothetical protein